MSSPQPCCGLRGEEAVWEDTRSRNGWKRKAGVVAATAAVTGLFVGGSRPINGNGYCDLTGRPPHAAMPQGTTTGGGYWIVTANGQVFAFGAAVNYGGLAGRRLNGPIVGIVPSPDGLGYWLIARDGGVFSFGSAQFSGSTGASPPRSPVVAVGAGPRSARRTSRSARSSWTHGRGWSDRANRSNRSPGCTGSCRRTGTGGASGCHWAPGRRWTSGRRRRHGRPGCTRSCRRLRARRVRRGHKGRTVPKDRRA